MLGLCFREEITPKPSLVRRIFLRIIWLLCSRLGNRGHFCCQQHTSRTQKWWYTVDVNDFKTDSQSTLACDVWLAPIGSRKVQPANHNELHLRRSSTIVYHELCRVCCYLTEETRNFWRVGKWKCCFYRRSNIRVQNKWNSNLFELAVNSTRTRIFEYSHSPSQKSLQRTLLLRNSHYTENFGWSRPNSYVSNVKG